MPSQQQIRFCTSRDGTRLAYAICGNGPPILWIGHWIRHLNLDWDCLIWRPWLEMLSRAYTVIRYDWRGCGLSDRKDLTYSHEKYVEDCEAVVEAVGLKSFVIIGMANGASTALPFAARHPEKVSHLVLWGSQTSGYIVRGRTPRQIEQCETRLKMIELGWPNDNPAYGQFFTLLHMPDAAPQQLCSYNELLRLATSPEIAIKLVRSFWETDIGTSLGRVRCPTLVLHARGDMIIPFEEGRLVASQIPGARFVPLDSRNHVPVDTEQAWQQMTETLRGFLPTPPRSVGTVFDELTAREGEVLRLVAQGLDNQAIASRLKISDKTVRNHVSIIFSKLGVSSRAQAVAFARDAGI
ncbi:alpha/beta fold hydrolase [Bradyrhizobium sp.]|uniref:alpha/beta fold hydrolase n=1 Tax=Bradyrhizobium sp. TaxID=376 RepID=UPI003C4FBCF8